MKKVYTSPDLEFIKICFENLLEDKLQGSKGEIGSRTGDNEGLDE